MYVILLTLQFCWWFACVQQVEPPQMTSSKITLPCCIAWKASPSTGKRQCHSQGECITSRVLTMLHSDGNFSVHSKFLYPKETEVLFFISAEFLQTYVNLSLLFKNTHSWETALLWIARNFEEFYLKCTIPIHEILRDLTKICTLAYFFLNITLQS